MEPQSRIFRQSALDKLSSPEQLDQLMQVTTPKAWLALAACAVLVLAALVWSIVGELPTTVSGRGILIKEGGVFVATAPGEGSVEQVLVEVGDSVKAGQCLVKLRQPELAMRIKQTAIAHQKLEEELSALITFQTDERRKEGEDLERQRQLYTKMLGDYENQREALKQRRAAQTELVNKGLLSKAQFSETESAIHAVEHDLARANIQLRQLDLNQLQADQRREQQLREKRIQILQSQHQLEYLQGLVKLNTEVHSPFDGTVLEVMVKPNQLIAANAALMSLQSDAQALQARVFLHAADGKQVRTSHSAAVSPVSVKKEEYGFIKGRVKKVHDFPATPQGMLGILENQALVNEFSQGGAPIQVIVELDRDPNQPDTFVWSANRRPEQPITSGTLCDATITIETRAPISMVLPIMKPKKSD
jgi:HlyD family secretion protein